MNQDSTDTGGLRSIERSKLSGAAGRSGGVRKQVRRNEGPIEMSQRPRTMRNIDRPRRRGRTATKKIMFLIIVIVAGALLLVTTTLSTATFNLKLASAELSIDGVFSAVREPAQSADISYNRRGPYTASREATITNVKRERQNTRATGTITVYNTNTSGEPINLINRTRFETKDGRIYRLIGRQSIPGGTTVSGKFIPGQREVKVEADSIGDQYNLENKDVRFTIPGLAKYAGFSKSYATSETRIVGGFSGERLIPDEEEESALREKLRREIKKEIESTLAQSLNTNTFSERIVFADGISIEYESLENKQTADGVTILEQGTLYAVSFREAELAALLAKYAPPSAPTGVAPTQINVTNINMKIADRKDFDPVSSTEFNFQLTGVAKLFWNVDMILFLSDVAGKKAAEVDVIIAEKYPQVTGTYELSLFPIWRTTVPGNKNKINLVINHTLDTNQPVDL